MRIYVLPSDMGPCGYFRLIWPAEALAREISVTVAPPGRRRWSLVPSGFDLVLMQRPIYSEDVEIVKMLREEGTAVVVDMDDDLSCVHPRNPNYKISTELHHNVEQACAAATLVTVTTAALGVRYGGHAILPNCIPEYYLRTPHVDSKVVGWGGNMRTHPGDMEILADAVAHLPGRFLVAGPANGVARELHLKVEPKATGHVSLSQWPASLAQIGIGIAPLAPGPFNEAKSWLKPLEYSAVGVPWVASPTTEYKALHARGAGLLATTPNEWWNHLHRLMRDPQERQELTAAGRDVARELTIESNAWRWAEVWHDAIEMERGKKPCVS